MPVNIYIYNHKSFTGHVEARNSIGAHALGGPRTCANPQCFPTWPLERATNGGDIQKTQQTISLESVYHFDEIGNFIAFPTSDREFEFGYMQSATEWERLRHPPLQIIVNHSICLPPLQTITIYQLKFSLRKWTLPQLVELQLQSSYYHSVVPMLSSAEFNLHLYPRISKTTSITGVIHVARDNFTNRTASTT